MPLPRHPAKHNSPAHFEPLDHLQYFQGVGYAPSDYVPQGVIFTYQRSLLRHIVATEAPEPVTCIVGKLYPLPSSGGAVAVAADFGLGAPVATMFLELLIAMGVRRFMSIGTCGALAPELRIGDLTVCTAAIRDEGVSHHYLPDAATPALPDPALTQRFATALEANGPPPLHGPTWTTDAPFRETAAEIAHFQAEGVLTVEMEAAALFAVAAHRGVPLASGLVVSDVLGAGPWNPQFSSEAIPAGLVRLFGAAVAAVR